MTAAMTRPPDLQNRQRLSVSPTRLCMSGTRSDLARGIHKAYLSESNSITASVLLHPSVNPVTCYNGSRQVWCGHGEGCSNIDHFNGTNPRTDPGSDVPLCESPQGSSDTPTMANNSPSRPSPTLKISTSPTTSYLHLPPPTPPQPPPTPVSRVRDCLRPDKSSSALSNI